MMHFYFILFFLSFAWKFLITYGHKLAQSNSTSTSWKCLILHIFMFMNTQCPYGQLGKGHGHSTPTDQHSPQELYMARISWAVVRFGICEFKICHFPSFHNSGQALMGLMDKWPWYCRTRNTSGRVSHNQVYHKSHCHVIRPFLSKNTKYDLIFHWNLIIIHPGT